MNGLGAGSKKLLRFFTIADIHISDPETPAQTIYFGFCGNNLDCSGVAAFKPYISSCFSPIMIYTTQFLDSTVQTINLMHNQDPFDFGIALGDVINNTEYKELRLFIDVMDGNNPIAPHSGNQSSSDIFNAVGLDRTISWYAVLGNHDHFYNGIFPVNDKLRAAYVGSSILQIGNPLIDPDAINKNTYYMGAINGFTNDGDINIIGVGPIPLATGSANDFTWWTWNNTPNKGAPTITPDPVRRSLIKQQWMGEFFNTKSNPVGHGFTQDNVNSGHAYYSFYPKPGIKVIVLDDTMPDAVIDDKIRIYGWGYIDNNQYDWLVKELNMGQAKDDLMIIAAHVPINVVPVDDRSGVAWTSSSPVSQAKVLATLHKYSNLILWISGHRHRNDITLQKSPDPSHPELGFWEVETSSLRDFPQEFRSFDIYRNSDNTVSIVTVDIDPVVTGEKSAWAPYYPPAELSRVYAIAAEQISPLPPGARYYNAELVKQLTVTEDVGNSWAMPTCITIGAATGVSALAYGGYYYYQYRMNLSREGLRHPMLAP